MRTKKINVKEVFKNASQYEKDKYLREKIVKLMISRQKTETTADIPVT